MASGEDARQVSIAFTFETTTWYRGLASRQRNTVDRRLRQLARDPESAPIRGTSPEGRTIYSAAIVIDEGGLWAFRIDFAIDEAMRRPALPAIIVLRARPVHR
jgi:hypothetical protein